MPKRHESDDEKEQSSQDTDKDSSDAESSDSDSSNDVDDNEDNEINEESDNEAEEEEEDRDDTAEPKQIRKIRCGNCHDYRNNNKQLNRLTGSQRKKYKHVCKKRCKSYAKCPTQWLAKHPKAKKAAEEKKKNEKDAAKTEKDKQKQEKREETQKKKDASSAKRKHLEENREKKKELFANASSDWQKRKSEKNILVEPTANSLAIVTSELRDCLKYVTMHSMLIIRLPTDVGKISEAFAAKSRAVQPAVDHLQQTVCLEKWDDINKEEVKLIELNNILKSRQTKLEERKTELAQVESLLEPLLKQAEGIKFADLLVLLQSKAKQ